MAHPTVPLEVLTRLYYDEKLPIADIAAKVGLCRQTVYTRFRRHGIPLYPEAVTPLETGRTLEPGRYAFLDVARDTGTRKPQSKYGYIKSLSIGDEIKVSVESGLPPQAIRLSAQKLKMRLVIRRIDNHTFRIVRTPLFDSGTIIALRNDGLSVEEIAKLYFKDPRTIARILENAR